MKEQAKMLNYQPGDKCLQGRVILITGAGDGIGRELSLTCADKGATVILLGRTQEKLEQVYDQIEQRGGPQAAIYPLNLEGAIESDYESLAQVLEDEFGRLDGLVHNASALGQRTPLSQYRAETFQQVLQVNVTAAFLMTKALLPLLKQSKDASIVFTSSSVGHKGRAFWGAYAISKAATENMAETLADELEDTSQIRVNTINPGATRTKMRASAYPAEDPKSVTAPADIMNRYLYLLGADSADVSGLHFDAQPK